MAVRIAIIEDDEALRDGLRLAFELDGWEVASAGTMREGNRLLMEGNCDLAILDCNLPDGSGFDMIKKLREFSRLPVLMLTARNSEIDEIRGLELGVDDFMKKPFSLAVLKARARKMLKKESQPSLLSSGDVTVDLKTGEVLRDSERVSLSNTELRLLVFYWNTQAGSSQKNRSLTVSGMQTEILWTRTRWQLPYGGCASK